MLRDILSRFHNIFLDTVSRLYRLSKNHNNIHWAIQCCLQYCSRNYIHNRCVLGNEYNSILSRSPTINSHRTTQVIQQLINTRNTQLSGGSDLSTHDTLCWWNSKKGNSFQTQSYGLNATINAQNHPLHSYHSPKNTNTSCSNHLPTTSDKSDPTRRQQQKPHLIKQPPNYLIGQYKYSHIYACATVTQHT